MTAIRNIFIFLCLQLLSCAAFSQTSGLHSLKKNYFIKEYPQEYFAVQCALQDRDGHMWFGTGGNGIFYYDGQTFTNITHKDGLRHDDILCCAEDSHGNIWFGTRNGLVHYKPSASKPRKSDFSNFLILANRADPSTHRRQPYTYRPAENFIWTIYEDKAGKLWFGTNKGIFTHDSRTHPVVDTPLFVPFLAGVTDKYDVARKTVTGIAEDKKGNLWFTSGYMNGDGIYSYDGKAIRQYKPGSYGSFRSILNARDGKLYFLSAFHGVYAYDGNDFTNFTQKIGMKNDSIISLLQDRLGDFWFGLAGNDLMNDGQGGAYHYDGRSLKYFTTKDGLSHNCVFSIVEDKSGNIWFGTRNTGLSRYDGKRFTDFTDRQ